MSHPSFRNSGPIERCIVVFPRRSVWIRHEGSRAFVADPNVVTIYNRAQVYEREPLSPDGDRCDWFAVSDAVARSIVAEFEPAVAERAGGPFRFERAPCDPTLYFGQRRLALRVGRGASDALQVESEVVELVSRVVAAAYRADSVTPVREDLTTRRQRDLVEAAKTVLVRTLSENRSVSDIARDTETSAFHLCRVFRHHTGQTLHEYRTAMRLRMAIERIADGGETLSTIAVDLGFSSHSHLVRICRQQLDVTPAQLRQSLLSEAGT